MLGIATYEDVLAIEREGIVVDLPQSTYEMIRRAAAAHPDAPALTFFLRAEDHTCPERWTYRAFLQRIHQTANFFESLGADKDTVIAYVLPNLPETHFVVWGGQATGIVFAINPMLEASAIADLLNAAGATILVTLAPFPGTDLWHKVEKVLPGVPDLRDVVLVSLADHTSGMRGGESAHARVLAGVAAAVPEHLLVHDFWDAVGHQPADSLCSERWFDPDDLSSFFCTGGTTGTPKIAMRRHRNEVFDAYSTARFLGDGIGRGKNIFCGLPLFHVNGVLVTGLLPFSTGAHVVLGTPQGYRGEGVVSRFWEIVEHHRINFFSGVPTLYANLLQIPVGQHRIDSLEYGICGAAPMPVEVFRRFQECTGLKILEGYGLTEATCVSSINPPAGERRVGSIGLRIPGQQMKAVQLDDNGRYLRDCEVGEVGVLVIAGPNVCSGYKQPEQNNGLWIEAGGGQCWLNTGDLGQQDAEGYFWLTGRKKELIIRGGHNLDPAAIEEPLHRHPAVEIAAAVGRPDVYAGELPVAYVQLKAGADVSEAELVAFAQREISERAAIPKHIRIVGQIPLTAVGKIFKPELKRRELVDAIACALTEVDIEASAIEVLDDKRRGMTVVVTLADSRRRDEVSALLGKFAVPCTIEA